MNIEINNKSTKHLGFAAMILAVLCLLAVLCGCGADKPADDIVIIYTSDVHCAVDENLGYSALAAYKSAMQQKTPYVTLVDCGDALQGSIIGSISKGEYLVKIMNRIGYDFAVLGNHEFDYGMQQLKSLIDESQATYLGCNITYSGSGENMLSAIKPYEIVTYGETKVGFIGVSTPESIIKSVPAYFMDENQNIVYDFGGTSGEAFYEAVQAAVDRCRAEGADYVVALTHLGTNESSSPFNSLDLIAGTNGIDPVLDGYSDNVISSAVVQNKDSEDVVLSSAGSELANIGQLMITSNGNLSASLISDYTKKDEAVDDLIAEIRSEHEGRLSEVLAHTDIALSINSENGVRMVRSRETNLGNFCADAYRAIAQSDIAFANGGGIRDELAAGDITYGDIISVHPYGNTLCVAEVTGQEIIDALEFGSKDTQVLAADEDKNAIGEFGGFLQVSGLKYTIDTSVKSGVQTDASGMLVSITGERRVKDVYVEGKDGIYEAIDPQKIYTLASHNYLIKQSGDGLNIFSDNTLIVDEGMPDYQILITYITDYLGGTIDEGYSDTQNRIKIEP